MVDLVFTKMHGCANDYVVVDGDPDRLADPAACVRAITDRRRGIGADGVLWVCDAVHASFQMRMFNPDGSEAEMCGNGLRCAVRFACERRGAPPVGVAQTGAGALAYDMSEGVDAIRVALGPPTDTFAHPVSLTLDGVHTPVVVHAGALGNPHAVVFVDDLDEMDVARVGSLIERHAQFPNRTNVEFVQVISRTHLRQRTWERGAGETLACGTGAGAVCVAAAASGRAERDVEIALRGGTLRVTWGDDHVVSLVGPAVVSFEGTWSLESSRSFEGRSDA